MEPVFIGQLFGVISKDVMPFVIISLILYHLYNSGKNIEKIEKSIEKHVSSTKEQIDKINIKIETMEREFITKEQHYQDFDGWRGEIHRLEDRMEKFFDRLIELIKSMEAKKWTRRINFWEEKFLTFCDMY